jgi:Uma2 family endonuclease
MATAAKTSFMTAEQFMAADLGAGRFELVRGEVEPMPPPMPEHGRVCMKAAFALELYGRTSALGYCLYDSAVATESDPDTVRGPDISFYTHARWPESEVGRRLPPVPPDLVVEVLSPGNRPGDMRKRISEYLDAGVSLVWVIDPPVRRVALYRPGELFPVFLNDQDVLENIPELPGFRCPVGDFFV